MQGSERREVVQATPADGVANRAAMPGVQMRYAKTPMAAEEAGRGAATLAMLAEKAMPAVQALHAQGMKEDFLKGQMQFSQGKAYADIKASGASYATVSGAAALHAQKLMQDTYIEGLKQIDAEDHKLTPEQYTAKVGEMSKSLFTGDELVDNFMTEIAAPQVMKLAEAQTKAHEAWKVQETKSAKRDLMLSTSKSTDADADMQLDALISSPMGLNQADHKEVLLESALLDMKQGSFRVFEKLGGIQGIREKFSTTAAEESAILSGAAALTEQKENEWSSEMNSVHMQNYRAVREGQITYEQGLENAERIAQKFGKGSKALRSMGDAIWGASNAYQNKQDAREQSLFDKHLRDLERAQVKAAEAQEIQSEAAYAVATGTIPLLDSKGKKAALQQLRASVLAETQGEIAAGVHHPQGSEMAMAEKYAGVLDRHGIVDDESAAMWTASMSRMNAVVDGDVSDGTMAAFKHLVALHKVNPGLALQHLKSEPAKNFFKMAVDLEEFGEDTKSAIIKASAAAKAEVTPKDLASRVGSKDFQDTLKGSLLERVKAETPGFIFGTDRGSIRNVSKEEVQRAASSPAVLNRLTRAVATKITADPNLTDEQATSLVLEDERQRGSYVLGSWITPRQGSLYDAMGLQGYKSETGIPMEAMTEYLADKGPEHFGRQWFDKDMFKPGYEWTTTLTNWRDSKVDAKVRQVPKVHVTMGTEDGEPTFIVSPILNSGVPSNSHMIIKAKDVGEHYKALRVKHDTEVGFISEAYGAAVRGAHTALTAPVVTKGGGPMVRATRALMGLTNTE